MRNPKRSNKAKERSSMEQEEKKKQLQKQISIHDILPLELIQRILLSVPARHLARFRCVSKLWNSLISDPHFAEFHLQHSPAPTHACLFVEQSAEAYLVHPEELSTDQNYEIKEVSLPFKNNPPSNILVIGSCRGFVLLYRHPHFLVVWNPLTGSSKNISYSFIVSRSKQPSWSSMFPDATSLYGLGYDASRDDYLVVVGWHDSDLQHHLDCFSLRTNSWINLDSALPKPFRLREWKSPGLFLNGSIHWLVDPYFRKAYSEALLIFDLKERTFSMISIPEQVVTYHDANLVLLGGCLAIYCRGYCAYKTDIWVLKDYKVHSSWTLYAFPGIYVKPLCLSNGSDIMALDCLPPINRPLWFVKYNVRSELFQRFECPSLSPLQHAYHLQHQNYSVYSESLLLLPGDSKHKDKKNNIM